MAYQDALRQTVSVIAQAQGVDGLQSLRKAMADVEAQSSTLAKAMLEDERSAREVLPAIAALSREWDRLNAAMKEGEKRNSLAESFVGLTSLSDDAKSLADSLTKVDISLAGVVRAAQDFRSKGIEAGFREATSEAERYEAKLKELAARTSQTTEESFAKKAADDMREAEAEADRYQAKLREMFERTGQEAREAAAQSAEGRAKGTQALIGELEAIREVREAENQRRQSEGDAQRARIEAYARSEEAARSESDTLKREAVESTDAVKNRERLIAEAVVSHTVQSRAAAEEQRAQSALTAAMTSGDADKIVAALQRVRQAEQAVELASKGVGPGLDAMNAASRRSAFQLLQVSYAAQDLTQSGFSAIINNVPGLVMAFDLPTKAAGGLMLGAVALDVALRASGPVIQEYAKNLGLIEDPSRKAAASLEEMEARLKAIEARTHKLDIDYQAIRDAKKALDDLKESHSAYESGKKDKIEKDLGAAVRDTVDQYTGGTDNLVEIIKEMDARNAGNGNIGYADASVVKKLAEVQKAYDSVTVDAKTGELHRGADGFQLSEAKENLRRSIQLGLENEVGLFQRGDPEAIARMQARARAEPDKFAQTGADGRTTAQAFADLPASREEQAKRNADAVRAEGLRKRISDALEDEAMSSEEKAQEVIAARDQLAALYRKEKDRKQDDERIDDAMRRVGKNATKETRDARTALERSFDDEERELSRQSQGVKSEIKQLFDRLKKAIADATEDAEAPIGGRQALIDKAVAEARTARTIGGSKLPPEDIAAIAEAGKDADRRLRAEAAREGKAGDRADAKEAREETAEQRQRNAQAAKFLPDFQPKVEAQILENERRLSLGRVVARTPDEFNYHTAMGNEPALRPQDLSTVMAQAIGNDLRRGEHDPSLANEIINQSAKKTQEQMVKTSANSAMGMNYVLDNQAMLAQMVQHNAAATAQLVNKAASLNAHLRRAANQGPTGQRFGSR